MSFVAARRKIPDHRRVYSGCSCLLGFRDWWAWAAQADAGGGEGVVNHRPSPVF